MSRAASREVQRAIQSRASLASVAALFYLSGALDADAEPASSDQAPSTQQAPPAAPQQQQAPQQQSPQPAPAPQPAPQQSEQKPNVPLPTVQVQAPRPRVAPRARPATPAPARLPAPPPPPAAAPAVDAAPSTPANTGDAAGATPYQVYNTGITRIPVPLLDIPQTVNVVTHQVIQEQRLTNIEDALRTVPGITFQAGEGGQQGDSPIIRGFVARTDIFRDGIRDPGWYTRDLFSVDRVEVYKGPSSFAFGRGATGGGINLVSKLPTGVQFIEGTMTATTGPGYRFDFDAGGKKDNVSGRISAMYQDLDTPTRDNVWTKRWGVAPSVLYDFQQGTKATLAYIYQGEESVPDYGHPYLPSPVYNPINGRLTNGGYFGDGRAVTPVPIPRNNWFGVANGPLRDRVDTEVHILTGKLEHEFSKDLKVSNVTRYVDVDRLARPTAPRSLGGSNDIAFGSAGAQNPLLYPVNQMTIGRQHFQNQTDNSLLVNQSDLVAKFNTGLLEHTLAAGMEFARETRFFQRARGMTDNNLCDPVNPLCRTSLVWPAETAFGGTFTGWNPGQDTLAHNYAGYASDQVKIGPHLELLGAVRYDYFNTVFDDPGNVVPASRHLERTDKLLSWRVGAVVKPVENASLYAAYGTSYNPSAELGTLSGAANNAANVLLDPERNDTIEVGGKIDLLGGKLSLTGAAFKIDKTNLRINNDPSSPQALQIIVLDGLARVKGIEVGVAGQLTDKWSIFAGYSYLDSGILVTRNQAELGRQLPNTPPHSFALWSTYAVTPYLTVGGGATYQFDTYANVTNTAYVPEFWKFDAMLAYQVTKNATLQLNVYNITDVLYYGQYYAGHAVPASGRWASLSLRVRY